MPKKQRRETLGYGSHSDLDYVLDKFQEISLASQPRRLTTEELLNLFGKMDKRSRTLLDISPRDLFRYEAEIYSSNCGTALRLLRNDVRDCYINGDVPLSQYRYLIFDQDSMV
mgnify:CR=1 FL=1